MDTVIQATDNYGQCLKDSAFGIKSEQSDMRPKGFVEVFDVTEDGNKTLVSKSNLVLYQGREFIGERIFNIDGGGSVDSYKDMFISWLGVGSGGAPEGNPLVPTAPVSTDTGLSQEVPFNAVTVSYGDFRGGNFYKHPFDLVNIEPDPANSDKYLICKVTVSIGVDDCNGSNLNEACLFISSTTDDSHPGPFYSFAKITFPTIVKDSSRSLMFIWYIYV